MTNESNKNKNNFVITSAAVIIIGGMAAFGFQMYENNSRVVELDTSVDGPDIPDSEGQSGEWIVNTGSNSCPIFIAQQFDDNKSHYRCMYLRWLENEI